MPMELAAIAKLFDMGIVGAVIFVLCWIIWKLLSWVQAMATETVAEARAQTKQTSDAVARNAVVVDRFTKTMEKYHDKLDDIHDYVARNIHNKPPGGN